MGTKPDSVRSVRSGAGTGSLLRKEWIVFSPRHRFYLFGVFFLAALQTVTLDEAYCLAGIALAAALALYVPAMEWHQGTERLLFSLPVARSKVVITRYLVAVLSVGIAWTAWSVTGRLLFPLLDAARSGPAPWRTLEGGLAFITSTALLFCLFFPLYFRLGMGRGVMAFLAVGLGLLVLDYAVAGPAIHAPFAPPCSVLLARMRLLIQTLGSAGALWMTLAVAAALFSASATLSMHWIEKREF